MSFEENNDPENKIPDWLKNLQDDLGDPAETLPMRVEKDDKDKKGRKYFSTESSNEISDPASDKKASDFLQGGFIEDEDEDDTNEWLNNILEQQKPVLKDALIEENEDSPDFLDRIQELKDADADESEDEVEDPLEQNPQDWLKGIADEDDDDDVQEDIEDGSEAMFSEEEKPDWLPETSTKHTAPLLSPEEIFIEEDKEVEEEAEVPDWLKKIQKGKGSTDTETSSDQVEELESEVSDETDDWIKKITGALDPNTLLDSQDFELEDDLDWIIDQDVSTKDSEEQKPGIEEAPEINTGQKPDWLQEMENNSFGADDFEVPETTISETPVEEKNNAVLEEFISDAEAIPDWLDSSDSPVDEDREELEPQPVEERISSTNMPNWLEDIRPEKELEVEPEEAPQQEPDLFGPLAGLENVLQAEPENVLFSSNLVSRVGLQVSQTQKSHISILQDILKDEVETPATEKQSLAIPQHVFRWLIAGLLYLAVLFPIINNQSATPLPIVVQPEITAMADIINSLEPSSPVLVAFEYQPGLTGEMEAASAAVLDHLLNQGAQLSFITTSATGPGLIEHYLDNILSKHSYIAEYKYPNFGFISGGTAALLNFASDPQNAVPIVYMQDGQGNFYNGWEAEPLNQIKEIKDFAMVLVITDDPITARSWIEQVQPYLVDKNNAENNIPLAMVISAQAKPLVFPYYDVEPKQVSAIVSGLFGGVSYETQSVQNNIASRYWDGFGNGLSATIVIVLFGGLINLIQGWRKTGKKVR